MKEGMENNNNVSQAESEDDLRRENRELKMQILYFSRFIEKLQGELKIFDVEKELLKDLHDIKDNNHHEMTNNINEIIKKEKDETVKHTMSVEEARQYMNEIIAKEQEKEQKKMDKALAKLDKKLESDDYYAKKVKEMIDSGVITKNDAINYKGKIKKFSDLVDVYSLKSEDDFDNDDNPFGFGNSSDSSNLSDEAPEES